MLSEAMCWMVSSLNREPSTNIAHYLIEDVTNTVYIYTRILLFVRGSHTSLPFPFHYNGFMIGEMVDR